MLPFAITRQLLRSRARDYPGSARNAFRRYYFAELIQALTKQALMDQFSAITRFTPAHELAPDAFRLWSGETLILCTADDAASVRQLEDLRALHPSARAHMFAQGGHHTVLLFPEAYNAALSGFLRGPAPGSAVEPR